MKRFYPGGSNFFLTDNNPEFNRVSESMSVEIVQEALSGSIVRLFDGLGLIVDSIAFLLLIGENLRILFFKNSRDRNWRELNNWSILYFKMFLLEDKSHSENQKTQKMWMTRVE